MEQNGAIHEGQAAFILGSPIEANPYLKYALLPNAGRHAEMKDLACQWDSGYAIAKRRAS
jgi:hypothetical protein